MTPSRTTSRLRFSTQTQVCFLPTLNCHPGLKINAHVAPHIGHLYTIVTADIFARFNRLANPNRPVHFVTGTDEHGLKIQRAAHGANRDPQVFCDRLSAEFRVRPFTMLLALSSTTHDRSGRDWRKKRTFPPQDSSGQQKRLTIVLPSMFGYASKFLIPPAAHSPSEKNLLKAKGLIYKGKHSGWYSVTDECFYSDPQVAETKPAGKPISGTTRYVSLETGSPVEWIREENYMFSLTSFRDQLLERIKSNPDFMYPPARYQELLDYFDSYMQDDLSISRPKSRLSWGVPVPDDPEHTMYVWFEALINYLTAIGYPSPTTADGTSAAWPPDLQVMGKDITR